jgi:hypothetical protein
MLIYHNKEQRFSGSVNFLFIVTFDKNVLKLYWDSCVLLGKAFIF